MIIPSQELEKRFFITTCNDFDGNCGDSGWFLWGRWILLGVIIVFFIALAFALRRISSKRVQSGKAPVTGTGWMVPPSYYQSQQQYGTQGPPAAPPYNPSPGQLDAGYYDNNGNFVEHNTQPGAYVPPPVPSEQQGYEMNSYYPYDRKGSRPVDGVDMPTPVHINESGSSGQYYPPPPGPPPGHIPQ